MKALFLIGCLLFGTALFAELQLKYKLNEAPVGSYLVIEQNKNYTFLHIQEKDATTIVIEEITVPAARFARCRLGWKPWFETGAPGNTMWLVSEVDTNSGQFLNTYSYTHRGWINLSDSNPFFTTLLNIPFYQVPSNCRKKVGNPPPPNRPDTRHAWNPRMIVEGSPVPRVPFSAWKARWPADGSELSRQVIEIYLPDEAVAGTYPTYFPYWLEVEGKLGLAKVRIVDSGFAARSPRERPGTL